MADFARSAHPGVQAQLDRLSMLSPAGDRLGLERTREILERLGRPQDQLPPIFHIAGEERLDEPGGVREAGVHVLPGHLQPVDVREIGRAHV